jgi:hypothetical protein
MLKRKPGAGPAKAGLDFVEDEQNVVSVAKPPQPHQPAGRRYNNPSFTLNGFDENSRGSGRDCLLDSTEITEWHAAEAWSEGAEALPIIRFG